MSFPLNSKATITGTSRADLNGQEVIVGNLANGRYTVVLPNGTSIKLKPERLSALASTGAIPGLPAPLQKLFNNPALQQYLTQITGALEQLNTMFPGYSPQMIIGGLLLTFFAVGFLLGFMRASLLVSIGIMFFKFGMPAYTQKGGGTSGMQAAAGAVGGTVGTKIKQVTGFTVSANQALLGLGVVLFLLFRLSAPAAAAAAVYRPSSSRGTGGEEDLDEEDEELFGVARQLYTWDDVTTAYTTGYNDVEKKKELTEGLNDFTTNNKKKEARAKRAEYSSAPPPMGGARTTAAASSGWGMGQYFTLFMIGNTVYSLGKTSSGGFDPSLVMVGLQTMPKWRLGLNAFLILRLFGLSPV